jgi:hypothetical protein
VSRQGEVATIPGEVGAKMVTKGPAICKAAMVVILFAIVFSSSTPTQAAEVGTQIYWAPEPGFGVLFLSVRIWPLEDFALSGGMGETVVGNATWPSLNAKALWRFADLNTMNLQTAASLLISYWLDDVLMPHFERVDLVWMMELEYHLMDHGSLSIGIGSPVGWGPVVTLAIGFHVMFDINVGFTEEER